MSPLYIQDQKPMKIWVANSNYLHYAGRGSRLGWRPWIWVWPALYSLLFSALAGWKPESVSCRDLQAEGRGLLLFTFGASWLAASVKWALWLAEADRQTQARQAGERVARGPSIHGGYKSWAGKCSKRKRRPNRPRSCLAESQIYVVGNRPC